MGYKYSKFSSVGFGRIYNEDTIDVIEVDDGMLFILCDGMGSENGSDSASGLAVKSIKSFFSLSSETDYLERLKSAIIETNDFIYNRTNGTGGPNKLATTIELLFLKSNTAYIAHVGDSRIYHFKNGMLTQLTKDHSLVQKLVDEGFLTFSQADNHPEKNVVIKAIGDKGFIEADLMKLKLNEYDINKFFICSDGVSGILSNEEISKLLLDTDNNTILNELSGLFKIRRAADDFSFIYIENCR